MGFGPTGIYTHDGTSGASLRLATASLESSLRNRIVVPFATTTARDAAYAGLSSSAKESIIAYIVNRGGHSYWDAASGGWEWLGVNRVVYSNTRASQASTGGGGGLGISIIAMPTTVSLPPGNRLIYIEAYSIASNDSASVASPRIFVNASIRDERYMAGGTNTANLAINRHIVASGSVAFDLRGLNGGGAVSFGSSSLMVIDKGPTDS